MLRLFLILVVLLGWSGIGWAQRTPVTYPPLQSAQTGNANGSEISVDGFSSLSATVTISGTATVNFESSQDQSTWVPVACIEVGDTAYTSITAVTATATVRCNIAGLVKFRARTSGNSGTVTVTATASPGVMGSGGGRGGGGGAGTLDQAFDGGKVIDGANSVANAVRIGDGTTPICLFTDATKGPWIKPCTDSDINTYILTNFNYRWYDIEGDAVMLTVDPDAASRNAMYRFGTNYKPLASIPVTLYPRGAASYSEASIVSNQPKGGYIKITDADTDAVDFRFVVTGKMVGITTATVRLYGVSDNATPSGNIVLNCAMRSNRPGTDTYVAHSTTGEAAITLTPATQNRPVSAVTSAITLNGTVAEFSEVEGSCEVNATSTTSAQLTDFFLRAEALVQLNFNSWSD